MPDSPPPPAATLRSVVVAFAGQPAVDSVDLVVDTGAHTAIAGANGAGKSTLMELLAGVRPPDVGAVQIHVDAVAFVPQRASVSDRLPLSVRDVVSIGAWGRAGAWRPLSRAARESIGELMERLDIAALSRRPFATLSGGQRQRALLAQGLARRADLLLLDEPTTGLDADSSLRIRQVIAEEAASGAAIVCVSHDPALLAEADRVVRMADGRIASDTAAVSVG